MLAVGFQISWIKHFFGSLSWDHGNIFVPWEVLGTIFKIQDFLNVLKTIFLNMAHWRSLILFYQNNYLAVMSWVV